VPRAARWPFELYVMPRRPVPGLEQLDATERRSLADLMPRLLTALDDLFDLPVPYIAGWRHSPVGQDSVRAHWRVFTSQRAAGKLKFLAGSETAYGAYINDVVPEEAARLLRKALG
jgi:UDPglucose--hexose-1-phosphate uridylyltransferase